MRILLTGASGFTGRHFQEHTSKAGHDIIPLTADITDPVEVRQNVQRVGAIDAVVHLAAISFVAHTNEAELYEVNTVGTTHLLTALAGLPSSDRPEKVLVASSANVYGNCPHSPIAETQPPAPVNHYAASKLAMEHLALTYLDRLPILITRPFNYTGIGQSKDFLIPKIVDCFAHRRPEIELGSTHIVREFNDVRFVVSQYSRLLELGKAGEIYNICTGTSYALLDILNFLIQMTGHQPVIQINPALVRNNEIPNLFGNPAKLQDLLGMQPEFDIKKLLVEMLGEYQQSISAPVSSKNHPFQR